MPQCSKTNRRPRAVRRFFPIASILTLFVLPSLGAEVRPGVEKVLDKTGPIVVGESPNSDYAPLADVQAAFELRVERDPVTRLLRVRGPGIVASLCPGMANVIVNGARHRLTQPIVYVNHDVFVPNEFARLLRENLGTHKVTLIAPTAPRPTVAAVQKLTVVVDAGHGGKDPGATGKNGLREKEVTLDVARHLARMLEAKGHKAILTRSSDHFLTLEERANFCRKHQPDLFISIHINASANLSASGIETYYSDTRLSLNKGGAKGPKAGDLDKRFEDVKEQLSTETRDFVYGIYFQEFQSEGQRLANAIQKALVPAFPERPNRGVKPGPWFVVRWSQAPAILVELGFVSNSKTEAEMNQAEHREKMARALMEGIEAYLR